MKHRLLLLMSINLVTTPLFAQKPAPAEPSAERPYSTQEFAHLVHPAVHKLFQIKDAIDHKNRDDIQILQTALKEVYPPKGILTLPQFLRNLESRLQRDQQTLTTLQEKLLQAGGKMKHSFPLYSCLNKFKGNPQEPGILKESIELLQHHRAVLGGDLACFGPRGPHDHGITLLKTLLLYALMEGRGAVNLADDKMADVVSQLSLIHPTPLILPDEADPLSEPAAPLSEETRDEIAQLAQAVSLWGALKEGDGFYFPNAGYVLGGNFYDAATADPYDPQPMGDCATFLRHLFVPQEPELHFSTFHLDWIERLLGNVEAQEDYYAQEKDERNVDVIRTLLPLCQRVPISNLQPGDLIVWRPMTPEGAIVEKIGHVGIFLGLDPHHPQKLLYASLRRKDGTGFKLTEGLVFERATLQELSQPEPTDLSWRTFGLRISPPEEEF